jgi:hypothetical protein
MHKVVEAAYTHTISLAISFLLGFPQYVHNIMVNIVSDLCRVPTAHFAFMRTGDVITEITGKLLIRPSIRSKSQKPVEIYCLRLDHISNGFQSCFACDPGNNRPK